LREFSDDARGADFAIIYFAGHGLEIEGTNYLIPIDAVLERDIDAFDEAIPLERLLNVIEPAKQLRLVILDACRDNPFAKSMKKAIVSRAIERGLAKIEPASPNTLIAYAAKAGSTAADGNARNSPFTAALVKYLPTPGLDLRKAFGFVRDDVLKVTRNKQEPFIYGSLGGNDVPLVPMPPALNTPVVDPSIAARDDYELAAQINVVAAWDSFLHKYPTGFYSDLARAQREKLMAAKLAAEQARLAADNEKKAAADARAAEAERARLAAEKKAADDAKAAEAERARLAAEKKATEDAKAAEAERVRLAAEKKAAEDARATEAERARVAAEAKAAEAERARITAEKAKAAELAKAKAAEDARIAAEKAKQAEAARAAQAARETTERLKAIADAQAAQAKADEAARAKAAPAPRNQQLAAALPVDTKTGQNVPAGPRARTGCAGPPLEASLSLDATRALLLPEECSLKPKDDFKECKDCPDMVVLPTGKFLMGSARSEIENGRADANEAPQHKVVMKERIAVGRYEVTRDQFAAFVAATGYKGSGRCFTFEQNVPKERENRSFLVPGYAQEGNHPAVCVSWNDANAYVVWLSKTTGKPYRLPSEAEFEYAARAGSTYRYAYIDDPANLCRFANGADEAAKVAGLPEDAPYMACNDGFAFTAPVGSLAANDFGLHDMIGNVWEWTADCFVDDYNGAGSDTAAHTEANCAAHTVRGGDWFSPPSSLRPAVRAKASSDAHHDDIGFRVVRTLAQ
jgi:formylglycine-generating enzyme required for sulfatase activity